MAHLRFGLSREGGPIEPTTTRIARNRRGRNVRFTPERGHRRSGDQTTNRLRKRTGLWIARHHCALSLAPHRSGSFATLAAIGRALSGLILIKV
jgi:hypothetical protein